MKRRGFRPETVARIDVQTKRAVFIMYPNWKHIEKYGYGNTQITNRREQMNCI